MAKSNAEILNHLYGLLIEMNFSRSEEDIYPANEYQMDAVIMQHLQQIKLKTGKYKALLNKSKYSLILEEIKRLREIGFDEIKKLLNPNEELQLQPLFRKFEEISKKDEESIAEDKELLELMMVLKDKIDKKTNE